MEEDIPSTQSYYIVLGFCFFFLIIQFRISLFYSSHAISPQISVLTLFFIYWLGGLGL